MFTSFSPDFLRKMFSNTRLLALKVEPLCKKQQKRNACYFRVLFCSPGFPFMVLLPERSCL